MMRKILILLLLSTSLAAFAQQVDDIALKDAGSGSQFNMSGLRQGNGAVIIFFGNKCAYNKYYINRINNLEKEFKSRNINFVLVNSYSSTLVAEESEVNMKNLLRANGISLPYLVDKDKILKKRLGATRSPEAFLLKFSGSEYKILYSGAIDDSPQSESDINHPYLRQAIISLLENSTPELNHVRPAGCLIR